MADQAMGLSIFSFGPPEIRLGSSLVKFPTRKTQALLIYLAIEGGLQQREHLAAFFWPEASPERSHGNLRNTLGHLQSSLRKVSGLRQTPYLNVTHNSLGLNLEANINLDVTTIELAYSQARSDRSSRMLSEGSTNLQLFRSAAAFQRGEFLAGFSLGDSPAFDDWTASQREVWHRRFGLVLDRLSEILFAKGDFASATDIASRWISIDPLNELAYRRKMRAHFAAGERGQALETYETCRALFASELDLEPEPDTVVLAEQIRTQPHPTRSVRRPIITLAHQPDTSITFLGKLFAGRVQERQTLIKHYALAADGQPQVVLISGEAGIGKTRLANKFLDWAKEQKSELLKASAFESGSHLPFQPLVDAIRARLIGEQSPRDLLDDSWIPALSRLLPELQRQGDPTPESANLEDITPLQIFEPFAQLTLTLARRSPLVLFIDDLQWADSATLDLLQYTIRRWSESANQKAASPRIMLLLSLRSTALSPENSSLRDAGLFDLAQWLERVSRDLPPIHVGLEPLEKLETAQMIETVLSPAAPDFSEWLFTETGGQPFYLIETLKDLLERRVLHPKRQKSGNWVYAVDAHHNLGKTVRTPSTVHAVVRSRLNRLSPNAFSLLAAAAVLEKPIYFEHLCAITNLSEDLALPALDELLSSRLLIETMSPDALGDYSFVNDMLRDVIYTEAGDARRKTYHRRALEILVESGSSAAVLAHHAFAAGLMALAFQHSLAAGQEAMRLSAVSEALIHFEKAQQLVEVVSTTEHLNKSDLQELINQIRRAYNLNIQTQ